MKHSHIFFVLAFLCICISIICSINIENNRGTLPEDEKNRYSWEIGITFSILLSIIFISLMILAIKKE